MSRPLTRIVGDETKPSFIAFCSESTSVFLSRISCFQHTPDRIERSRQVRVRASTTRTGLKVNEHEVDLDHLPHVVGCCHVGCRHLGFLSGWFVLSLHPGRRDELEKDAKPSAVSPCENLRSGQNQPTLAERFSDSPEFHSLL